MSGEALPRSSTAEAIENRLAFNLSKSSKKTKPAIALHYSELRRAKAVWTGLEPATSGVTGRHSNQTELPHQYVK
jgi:hypothetical protein